MLHDIFFLLNFDTNNRLLADIIQLFTFIFELHYIIFIFKNKILQYYLHYLYIQIF